MADFDQNFLFCERIVRQAVEGTITKFTADEVPLRSTYSAFCNFRKKVRENRLKYASLVPVVRKVEFTLIPEIALIIKPKKAAYIYKLEKELLTLEQCISD